MTLSTQSTTGLAAAGFSQAHIDAFNKNPHTSNVINQWFTNPPKNSSVKYQTDSTESAYMDDGKTEKIVIGNQGGRTEN